MLLDLLHLIRKQVFGVPSSSAEKVISVLTKQAHVDTDKLEEFKQSIDLSDGNHFGAALLLEAFPLHIAIHAKRSAAFFQTMTPPAFERELLESLVDASLQACAVQVSPREETTRLLGQIDEIGAYMALVRNRPDANIAEAMAEGYLRIVNCSNANDIATRVYALGRLNARMEPNANFFKGLAENGHFA